MKTDVAAYYFPHWHPDPKNDWAHGKNWTEWELVKTATPRFPGHEQPKIPVWGYEDESQPEVMARKINTAADYGIDAFIFDWLYYPDMTPPHFLNHAIERGYFGVSDNNRLKFALMWVYHPRCNMHPAQKRNPPQVLFPVKTTVDKFERMTDYIIQQYFTRPDYWRINDDLYFSLYGMGNLIADLGVETAAGLFDSFRNKTLASGLGHLHLNATINFYAVLPDEKTGYYETDSAAFLKLVNPDSLTVYNWCHLGCYPPDFPAFPYPLWRDTCMLKQEELASHAACPFIPNVTLGWDVSPRTIQTDTWENIGYPFTSIAVDNSIPEIKSAFMSARNLLEQRNDPFKVLTVNAWNEWTEGCYLEPDKRNGFGYLNALREVFGS